MNPKIKLSNILGVISHYGINDAGGGLSTVTIDPDGSVLSVFPDTGELQARPAGTAGPWEKGRVSGNLVSYDTAKGPVVYALARAV